jgi:predicted PurR-regulated permease PerM
VAIATFALLIAIYWQLATPILWAGTLAVLFYPLHRLMVRLVRGRETLGAVLSTAVVLAVVFVPAIFVVIHLARRCGTSFPR